MKFSVVLEKINDKEIGMGYYYAHVPTLGLTTHGFGIEGAMSACRDLVQLWLAEKKRIMKNSLNQKKSIFQH